MREYDQIADWYASDRKAPTGIPEVAALASSIPPGGRVLDVGCGNGLPPTRRILDAGHRVIGLDSSEKMLARFRLNLPLTPAIRGLVQNCPFTDEGFDAALAWGVIFHLTRDEQARALASVSRVLRVGAPFLFTAGDVNDVNDGITGTMNGVTFRYYSFGVDGYRALLNHNRLTLVDVHKDDGANTYYLARKTTS